MSSDALQRAWRALWQWSAVRFAAVGISNTLVGLSVIYVCWRFLGWSDFGSNATGYAVGLAWSFVWHRRLTFRANTPVGRGLVGYGLVCLAAYAINLGCVAASRAWLGPASFLPHVIGNVAYSAFVYGACRWFVFPSPDDAALPGNGRG